MTTKGALTGIGLEVVGRCNAVCKFCAAPHGITTTNVVTGEVLERPKGPIEMELLEAIFEAHPIRNIICTGIMEPLLAPDRVLWILDKLDAVGGSVAIYTNGQPLTPQLSEQILAHPSLVSISFSLNAATDDTRRAVMGLPLERAKQNLLAFLDLQRAAGRSLPVGVTMMLTPHNRHEEQAFKAEWEAVKDVAQVGTFWATNWGGAVPDYWMQRVAGKACCLQWTCLSPTVSSHGQLYLCCYNGRWSFGSVLDHDAVARFLNRRQTYGVTDDGNPDNYPSLCADCSHRFSLRPNWYD